MYGRHARLLQRWLVAIDSVVAFMAFLLAFLVRFWVGEASRIPGALPSWLSGLEVPQVTDSGAYLALGAAMIPAWSLALFLSGTNDFRLGYGRMAVRYARAVALALAFLVTASFLFKLQFVARSFVLLYGVTALVTLCIGRYMLLETVAAIRKRKVDGHRVLIVGCGDAALSFAASLRDAPLWRVKILGHVCVEGELSNDEAQPRMGSLSALDQILDSQPVDEVLFAVPGLPSERLADALQFCDERGVDVLLPLPPHLPSRAKVEVATIEGFDVPLLGLRRTPTGEARLALKRLIDILGSLVLITLASPLMLVAAIAIRLESPGPVLFRQVRAGRKGRKFKMLKFRSMCVDAEAKKQELKHLNEMDGPVFKIRKDPRITKVGALIRKTSVDELPQLFNILMGHMSLVGPRPPLPSEVAEYKPWQRRRLSVKPGLTGLWQVSGRNDVNFEEWMQMDLRYIDDWSIWLDVKILFRTVPAVLFRSGAS